MTRFVLLGLVALVCSESALGQAEPWRLNLFDDTLSIGGAARLRYEVKDDFNFDDQDDDYFLTRMRLNLKWQPCDIFSAFIEGQDARIFEEDVANEDAVPNTFADSFDLHQAYFDFNLKPAENLPLRIRTGRQKLIFGKERVLGASEWTNTAREFDALRLTLGTQKERTLDAFASRVVAPDNDNPNDWAKTGNRYSDGDFHGLYYTDWLLIPNTQFEGYWLFRHNDDADDAVHTLGMRLAATLEAWDFEGEFIGQLGEYADLDHAAFGTHVEAGYTAASLNNTRAALAYSFGSGDSDATDGDHTTFDNLYPTNHMHYGYMDFFSLQNMHNGEVNLQTKFFKDLEVRVAYHSFWLAEEDDDAWYNAGSGVQRRAAADANVDPYVGGEVDLTVKYPLFEKRVWLEAGYGHFFAGSYVDDTGADGDADFFYTQSMVTF